MQPSTMGAVKWLRILLWTFFLLWVFEGALRKWVLPQLSDALLFLRDPLAILMYGIALSNRMLRMNWFLAVSYFVSMLCLLAGLIVLTHAPVVILFGFRSDFFYLPLVFLIPSIWNRDDVERLGPVTLLIATAMAPLIVLQFISSPEAWVNVGTSGTVGGQLITARGHIRPPGTFSYVLGPTCFYSLATAFLVGSLFSKRSIPLWLISASAVGIVTATITSGSRTQLILVGMITVVGLVSISIIRPKLLPKVCAIIALLTVAMGVASQLSFFEEGTSTLTERFMGHEETVEAGVQRGILGRMASDFDDAMSKFSQAPLLGHGLGAGTLVGARLLTGETDFSLGESEWIRIVMESGPILGGMYLILRWLLTLLLIQIALRAALQRGNVLPLLLCTAAAPQVLLGLWSQTTVLGFAVFAAGLVLAAANEPDEISEWGGLLASQRGA